jgi:signal transduction histidine kinase
MLGPLAEVLKDGDTLSPTQKENLQVSLRNTLRLQKLVNTLLDFAKIEAGKLEARFEEVEISQMTKDLASSFRSAIELSGITYEVSVDRLKHAISVDVDMWENIVLNLISNAFKYTEKGKIKVGLYEINNALTFEVSDSGIGLGDDQLDKIFDRFYRINNQRGRSQEGTGIGLAMVKELVHLHEGEISVKSKVGEGSTFTVVIPFAKIGSPSKSETNGRDRNTQIKRAFVEEASKWNLQPVETPERTPTAKELAGKPHIIIADDNSDMRDYIIRLLGCSCPSHTPAAGERRARCRRL